MNIYIYIERERERERERESKGVRVCVRVRHARVHACMDVCTDVRGCDRKHKTVRRRGTQRKKKKKREKKSGVHTRLSSRVPKTKRCKTLFQI